MPELCRFLGIVIKMYYNDHNPPHFHAEYNQYSAEITINDLIIRNGHLPQKVFRIVQEWAFEHQEELMEDWILAQSKKTLKPIDPLNLDN